MPTHVTVSGMELGPEPWHRAGAATVEVFMPMPLSGHLCSEQLGDKPAAGSPGVAPSAPLQVFSAVQQRSADLGWRGTGESRGSVEGGDAKEGGAIEPQDFKEEIPSSEHHLP